MAFCDAIEESPRSELPMVAMERVQLGQLFGSTCAEVVDLQEDYLQEMLLQDTSLKISA